MLVDDDKAFFISFLKSFSQSEDWGILRSAKGNDVIYEPWQIVFYLSVAVVAGILASLLTAKPNEDKVKLFHDLIGTTVQPKEIIEKSCTLPIGVIPASRKKWSKNTSFEICAPSKVSCIGFGLSWLAMGIMVMAFKAIIGN